MAPFRQKLLSMVVTVYKPLKIGVYNENTARPFTTKILAGAVIIYKSR